MRPKLRFELVRDFMWTINWILMYVKYCNRPLTEVDKHLLITIASLDELVLRCAKIITSRLYITTKFYFLNFTTYISSSWIHRLTVKHFEIKKYFSKKY